MMPNRHTSRKSSRAQRLFKQFMKGVFRSLWWFSGRRHRSTARAGFVFPTTLLLLLMVTLTATALTYRTFSRSSQVITQRQQQVVYNAATPAIDRARAKIEFLFQQDNRIPSGVPPSDRLSDMLLPEGSRVLLNEDEDPPVPLVANLSAVDGDPLEDPYTLPGEDRLDINRDGTLDNAWIFDSGQDVDGDGINEKVIYSLILDDQGPGATPFDDDDAVFMTDADDAAKAEALVTRTGPLATTEATPLCKAAIAEGGWQIVSAGDNANLQKNFQVNALVVPSRGRTQSIETLEFQQSRIAARANKWGAWFRYDLELHPGQPFNWNGAMHADGNIVLNGRIEPFMVSSEKSCVYSQESSEITLGEFNNDGVDGILVGDPNAAEAGTLGDFQGQAIIASTRDNAYTGASIPVHIFSTDDDPPNRQNLTQNNDSVNGGLPSEVAMNPLILFAQDQESHVDPTTWTRPGAWENSNFVNGARIINDSVSRPFVDDFFRADDRWGPKPRYDATDPTLDITTLPNISIGDDIEDTTNTDYDAATDARLTNSVDGLDGYWERQAVRTGMRIVVGQRLELGNANGWGYDPTPEYAAYTLPAASVGDPLYPPKDLDYTANTRIGGPNEQLHRKSLRDNLAAVQGMVVYHYQINDGRFPAACMAATAHPGTEQTIINSRTFNNYPVSGELKADFFTGNGTNGLEFGFPADYDTEDEFKTQLDEDDPLGKALRNWAYFAGDPLGGAPSFSPVQETTTTEEVDDPDSTDPADTITVTNYGQVHPAPYMSMWGDASNLRRIFDDYLDNTTTTFTYDDLSVADKTTLHSAACTISLLAYNVDTAIAEYESVAGENLTDVGEQFWKFINPGSPDDLSDLVGATYDTFPATHPLYPNEPIILTPGIPERDDWVDPNHTGTTGNTCIDVADTDSEDFEEGCDERDYYDQFTPEDFIRAYIAKNSNNATRLATALTDVQKIQSFIGGYQILRDRALGFVRGPIPSGLGLEPGDQVQWDANESVTLPGDAAQTRDKKYSSTCDPDIFTGIGGSGVGKATKKIGLAVAFCSTKLDTKYPSLYYLFPLVDHGHGGANSGGFDHTQPAGAEEYIDNEYVRDTNDGADRYKIIDTGTPASGADPEVPAVPQDVSDIAAAPVDVVGNWVLPIDTTVQTELNDPDAQPFRISLGAIGYDVPFLDKGMFDGRELLNIRVLDIDLEALIGNTTDGGDYWLSADITNRAEGVVYAFREDAVREDEIVRAQASGVTFTDCMEADTGEDLIFALEREPACLMNFAEEAQDPPLTDEGISLKPVDFIPDGDRRSYGFRLRTLSGDPADFSGGDPDADDARRVGMTFVTDNSVYILGNFNPHSSDGGVTNLLEEFDETILGGAFGFNDFYGGNRETLNTDTFANLSADHWRPVEVLSDSMSILSNSFRDGAISDMVTIRDGQAANMTSYTNQTRPDLNGDRPLANWWVQEDPDDPNSPLWIDRNGVYYWTGNAANTVRPFYDQFTTDDTADRGWIEHNDGNNRGNNVQVPVQDDIYVNAIFVSGIVPRRPRQGYGGLHNYPRFLEDWVDKNVNIQGAFLQLNFSTAGTGPYEQEAFEPGQNTVNREDIDYYEAPNRRWGYDVGLLYVPPSAAARRFVSLGNARSEYYREIPADDPYIEQLKCAVDTDGDVVLTNANGDPLFDCP